MQPAGRLIPRAAETGSTGSRADSGRETSGIPRYRETRLPRVFSQGFRPFFLGAGVWALVMILVWLPVFRGDFAVPTAFSPLAWHAHEMLFGFVGAVVAGFLLTAIPNWTGRMPLQGASLAVLWVLWAAGRIAVCASAAIGPLAAGVVDLAFPLSLLAVVLREIVAGRNWRNLPMPLALALFVAANALTHAEALGLAETGALGQRLGIAVVVMLIGLIGGRIVPSFTRNWLAKRGETRLPAQPGRFDRVTLATTAAALVLWIVAPDAAVAGLFLVAAGVLSTGRLARWRGAAALGEPLVWSLHAGFAWVPVGLVLVGAAVLVPAAIPFQAGLHALTAGAMGGMTLAVMTRATLGHTGRALTADGWTAAIYVAVGLAALARVAAPFAPGVYVPALWVSAGLWAVAFALFTGRYGCYLLGR